MASADDLIQVIADKPLEGSAGGLELTISLLVQSSILDWAGDLQRNIERVKRDAGAATEKGLSDEGLDLVERSLWSFAAARKSLLAVCFLCLGVPTIKPGWIDKARDGVMKGIEFELNVKLLARRLAQLADEHWLAGQLNDALLQLANHPAMELRNEVTDSLAPITEARGLCYFEIIEGDQARLQPPVNFLWPRGMAKKADIAAKTLYQDALEILKEGQHVLDRAVQLAAKLIDETGVVTRPQRVYIHPETGATRVTGGLVP